MTQQYLRIAFSRSHLPFSYGIRLYDGIKNFKDIKEFKLPYSSHAALVDGDNVVESTFSHGGVKEDTLVNFKKRASEWCIVDIPVNDAKAAIDAIRAQIGKPYDWTAIYGFLVSNRNYQEDDAWFCIELLAYGLHMGGTCYFEPMEHSQITPDMLFKLPHVFVESSANFAY